MGFTVPHECPACHLSPCTIGLPCIFVRSLKAGFASSSFSVFPGQTYGRYFIKDWWNDWINQPTFQLGVATCYWSLGACHSEFLTRLEVFKLGNSTLPSFLFYFLFVWSRGSSCMIIWLSLVGAAGLGWEPTGVRRPLSYHPEHGWGGGWEPKHTLANTFMALKSGWIQPLLLISSHQLVHSALLPLDLRNTCFLVD